MATITRTCPICGSDVNHTRFVLDGNRYCNLVCFLKGKKDMADKKSASSHSPFAQRQQRLSKPTTHHPFPFAGERSVNFRDKMVNKESVTEKEEVKEPAVSAENNVITENDAEVSSPEAVQAESVAKPTTKRKTSTKKSATKGSEN